MLVSSCRTRSGVFVAVFDFVVVVDVNFSVAVIFVFVVDDAVNFVVEVFWMWLLLFLLQLEI